MFLESILACEVFIGTLWLQGNAAAFHFLWQSESFIEYFWALSLFQNTCWISWLSSLKSGLGFYPCHLSNYFMSTYILKKIILTFSKFLLIVFSNLWIFMCTHFYVWMTCILNLSLEYHKVETGRFVLLLLVMQHCQLEALVTIKFLSCGPVDKLKWVAYLQILKDHICTGEIPPKSFNYSRTYI